ncbi:MAG: hypothetical protein ACTTJW_01035 [Sphaerochaeta sp.]
MSTLSEEYSVFRPSGDGLLIRSGFARARVSGVKLAQPSHGWSIEANGAVNESTATLFFHPGKSTITPVSGEWNSLQVGDILCNLTDAAEPPSERFVVKRITRQSFKGRFHHFEMMLT